MAVRTVALTTVCVYVCVSEWESLMFQHQRRKRGDEYAAPAESASVLADKPVCLCLEQGQIDWSEK